MTFEAKPILPDDHAIPPGNLKITDRVAHWIPAHGPRVRLAIGLTRTKHKRRPPDGHPAPFSRPRGAADSPRDDWLGSRRGTFTW
jgi:hypothetical protein